MSHHPFIGYFLIRTQPEVFYSLHKLSEVTAVALSMIMKPSVWQTDFTGDQCR